MQRSSSFPETMTPKQAAEYLQVSQETVYRYIRQGKLGASRLGGRYRVTKRNLDLLISYQTVLAKSSEVSGLMV